MVLRAREDKGLLAEQPLDGFGKTANDDAPRPRIDSRSDPAVGNRQKLIVFGEPEKSGALQPEKLAETSEPRSERLVHLGAGKVHERAGEAGEQLLEAEALAQGFLRSSSFFYQRPPRHERERPDAHDDPEGPDNFRPPRHPKTS